MRSEHRLLFNNEEVEYAEQYKYLGLLLTEHLEWEKATGSALTKATELTRYMKN